MTRVIIISAAALLLGATPALARGDLHAYHQATDPSWSCKRLSANFPNSFINKCFECEAKGMHFFQDNLPKDPSDFASGRGHCVPAPGEKSVDEAARAQDAPQTGPGTQEKSPGAGPGKTEVADLDQKCGNLGGRWDEEAAVAACQKLVRESKMRYDNCKKDERKACFSSFYWNLQELSNSQYNDGEISAALETAQLVNHILAEAREYLPSKTHERVGANLASIRIKCLYRLQRGPEAEVLYNLATYSFASSDPVARVWLVSSYAEALASEGQFATTINLIDRELSKSDVSDKDNQSWLLYTLAKIQSSKGRTQRSP